MPHSAFSNFYRRIFPSRWLFLLPGGLVALSGCFQAQALYHSFSPTGRPGIEELEASSFPLPPALFSQGGQMQAPVGAPSHPGWQQQPEMPQQQPGIQASPGMQAHPAWQAQPQRPIPFPTTQISPATTGGQSLTEEGPADAGPGTVAASANSADSTPEPVGNRMADWLRNAAFGPNENSPDSAAAAETSRLTLAAAAAPQSRNVHPSPGGTVHLSAAPSNATTGNSGTARGLAPAISQSVASGQTAGPSAPPARLTGQPAHRAAQPAVVTLSAAGAPLHSSAPSPARDQQPVPVREAAPIRLLGATGPSPADRLEPTPDPTVPSARLIQTAAARQPHTPQAVHPAQYSRPVPVTEGPASPVMAAGAQTAGVGAAGVHTVAVRANPVPAQPAPLKPLPGSQQEKAIRVAALLKALVHEDQQPGGGELARRQRLMGLSEEQISTEAATSSATAAVAATVRAEQNTTETTDTDVPRITATPVAVSLSAIMDAPGDGLPARIPSADVLAQSTPGSPANTTTPASATTDRTRLAEQVRRLSEQLQVLATPQSQQGTAGGSAPFQVQQVSWQSAAPPAGTISNEATVALLMLRIEQISAQLHQLQSATPAMSRAALAGGGWQYQNRTAPAQPAPAPAAISPAELQMLAAVLNRATAATAERQQTISPRAVPVAPAIHQPAAHAGNAQSEPADLTQLAGRVAELARQLETVSQP